MTTEKPAAIDLPQALLNPSSVFATPEEVVWCSDLTRQQKIDILRRWEYDANEEAVAEEEGMQSEQPLMVRRVVLALEQLTGGDEGSASPTKLDGA
jgi:hypothetical protein